MLLRARYPLFSLCSNIFKQLNNFRLMSSAQAQNFKRLAVYSFKNLSPNKIKTLDIWNER